MTEREPHTEEVELCDLRLELLDSKVNEFRMNDLPRQRLVKKLSSNGKALMDIVIDDDISDAI